MTLIGIANDTDAKNGKLPGDFASWYGRVAVRAVLFDNKQRIALMHIGKRDFYKLPGGGVEEEEDLKSAFVREVEEETGYISKATGDIGMFVEKREEEKMLQVSFCYLAVVEKKGEVNLTESEADEQFSVVWVDSIDEAIRLLSSSTSQEYDDQYMRVRDTEILKAAKAIFQKQY